MAAPRSAAPTYGAYGASPAYSPASYATGGYGISGATSRPGLAPTYGASVAPSYGASAVGGYGRSNVISSPAYSQKSTAPTYGASTTSGFGAPRAANVVGGGVSAGGLSAGGFTGGA